MTNTYAMALGLLLAGFHKCTNRAGPQIEGVGETGMTSWVV